MDTDEPRTDEPRNEIGPDETDGPAAALAAVAGPLPDRSEPLPVLDDRGRDLLFREAHTAYTFSPEPVDPDVLARLWELIRNAPTSFNSQPLRILHIASAAARETVVAACHPSNRAKTRAAPLTLLLAADHRFDRTLGEAFPALPGAERAFPDAAFRQRWARFNASLQVGYLLIAVRALGLAAGPVGGMDQAALDDALLAGRDWSSLCLVNIGHPGPDAFYPRSPRLDVGDVVTTV